jgi:hypothetical protein
LLSRERRGIDSRFVEAEYLEPTGVFLGSVPDQILCVNIVLLSVALGDVDYARTLGA